MVRKITDKVPEKVLAADLERYRQEAIKLGATYTCALFMVAVNTLI